MHQLRLHWITVIVAGEVEDAVRDEQAEFQPGGNAEASGLPPGRICRDHDLPHESARRLRHFDGEGQHVRPPTDAPEGAVETADLSVVDDRDLDDSPHPPQRSQRAVGGPGEPPARHGNAALAVLESRAH